LICSRNDWTRPHRVIIKKGFFDKTSAVANLDHLTCLRPLPIKGNGRIAMDLGCTPAQVHFSSDLCLLKAATWRKMSRVLSRVLNEFLPVFPTAFECFC